VARYVTVASVSHDSGPAFHGDVSALLAHADHMLWRARQQGAEIVSFPEIYPLRERPGTPRALAEPLDGVTISHIGGKARELGLYVVWPLYTLEQDRVYNSSVLLSPRGEVAGVYHKVHPTISEIESGITPGEGAPVFKTDFGTIGLAICFDLNFPDIMYGLGDNGAEIIFFSSAYRGGLQLRIWAYLLGVYIVSAVLAELGHIVDMSGQLLATSTYEELITYRLNLDRRLMHMDYNWDKWDDLLRRYGPDVSIQFFTPEAVWTVASEREGLSVEDIIREFGLEERRDYWRRSNVAREQALGR